MMMQHWSCVVVCEIERRERERLYDEACSMKLFFFCTPHNGTVGRGCVSNFPHQNKRWEISNHNLCFKSVSIIISYQCRGNSAMKHLFHRYLLMWIYLHKTYIQLYKHLKLNRKTKPGTIRLWAHFNISLFTLKLNSKIHPTLYHVKSFLIHQAQVLSRDSDPGHPMPNHNGISLLTQLSKRRLWRGNHM